MKHAVITDERCGDVGALDARRLAVDDDCVALVRELVDDGVEAIVVVGDDATLSRLATAYAERLRDRTELLRFFVVSQGDATSVADRVESPPARRATFRKLERLLRDATVHRVPTLRIVDSAAPGARLGFAIGMGLPYDFWATYRQSGRAGRVGAAEAFARLAKEGLGGRTERAVEADVFVDWELRAERFGYFTAAALAHTWFDISMAEEGPAFRLGNSALELVGARSRVGRFVERARGAGVERFDRIHIDTNSGYVVDGELCSSERPRTVAVTSGPTIQCLAP